MISSERVSPGDRVRRSVEAQRDVLMEILHKHLNDQDTPKGHRRSTSKSTVPGRSSARNSVRRTSTLKEETVVSYSYLLPDYTFLNGCSRY